MIDGKSLLDQTVKSDMRTYNNIRKNSTGKGNDYTTGCLLDYTHFKDDSNRFSKQHALETDPNFNLASEFYRKSKTRRK